MKRDSMNDENELIPESEAHAPDEPDLEAEEGTLRGKLKDLREKLKQCEQEKREHLEALHRAKADYLNSKRRLEEQYETNQERATLKHVELLLPLCDSFEAAMGDREAWEAHDETWRKGIEGIYRELKNILAHYRVEPFGAAGEQFDPALHEAVGNEKTDAEQVERIVRTIQRGYRKEETVIRPARVIVGTEE